MTKKRLSWMGLALVFAAVSPCGIVLAQTPSKSAMLGKFQSGVKSACATVAGWKVMDPLASDPDKQMIKDPSASAADKERARQRLLQNDADAVGLKDSDEQDLYKNMSTIKGYCVAVLDKDHGLPALTAGGASADKINGDLWEKIEDNLDGLLMEYSGKGAMPDESGPSYSDQYGGDETAATARVRLAAGAEKDLGVILASMANPDKTVLSCAVENAQGKKDEDCPAPANSK